ncbi:MAG: amino acid ABC transporter permease [Gammaproteobacteria bacterium]
MSGGERFGGAGGGIPMHRDPKVRAVAFQAAAVLFFVWALWTIGGNTVANMEERGIILGLSWLEKLAPFQVGFSPFLDNALGENIYWRIFFIGVQNTIYVSFFGIVAATFLGFVIGVMRLSPNWLVAKIASVYVEIFRNIPLLLWFFFWYFIVFLPSLPGVRDSVSFADAVFINKSGLYFPRPVVEDGVGAAAFLLLCFAAVAGVVFLARWAKNRQEKTGEQFPLTAASLAVLVLVPVAAFFISGAPYSLEYSELGAFQLSGGINLTTEFFVVWFALTTYTAAFIGENVRGGILSVSHGQTEAARALGLHHGQNIKLVVIPQAMRVIIPPTISQYLNLTKNSTLAIAIAYEEIASIWMGISLNTTGQSLIIIAMTVGVFWTLSFLTSAVLNWYNKRVQLTER